MLITCPKCSVQYQIPEEVRLVAGRKIKCSNCQHVFIFSNDESVPASVEDQDVQLMEIDPVVEETAADDAVFAEDDVFQSDDVPQPFVPVASAPQNDKKGTSVLAAFLSALLLFALIVLGIVYREDLFGRWLSFGQRETTDSDSKFDYKLDVITPNDKKNSVNQMPSLKPVLNYEEQAPQIVSLPQIRSVQFEKRQDLDTEIRIEGVLENVSNEVMHLPPKVRAVAYDSAGQVLFEKEIYLTDKELPAGKTLSFFGTYQPAPDGVQWVDVTF